MSEYPIPKRASGEKILDIIRAYYGVGAHHDPVSSAEVDEMLGTSDITGRQTSFFDAVNIVEKNGQKRKLTSEGEEIAEALMADEDADLAKERLRGLLKDWEFAERIVNFVSMRDEGVSEEQVLEFIQSNAKSQDDRGMGAIIDLLKWSELLSDDESTGNITTVSNPVTESANPVTGSESNSGSQNRTTGEDSPANEEEAGKSNLDKQKEETTTDRIEVSFEFDADDAPSEIEATIRAARRALEEDLE